MSIGTDRSLSEELVTWLPLIEALVLPYFLWFGSRRYKHAISYIFKVHILRRNHDNEESELHLLSYTIDISYSFYTNRKSSCRFALLKKSLISRLFVDICINVLHQESRFIFNSILVQLLNMFD